MSHNEGAASSKSGRALAKNFLTSCDLVLPMLHEFPAICLLNIRDLWLSATAFVQPAAEKAEVALRFPSVSAAFTNREIASDLAWLTSYSRRKPTTTKPVLK